LCGHTSRNILMGRVILGLRCVLANPLQPTPGIMTTSTFDASMQMHQAHWRGSRGRMRGWANPAFTFSSFPLRCTFRNVKGLRIKAPADHEGALGLSYLSVVVSQHFVNATLYILASTVVHCKILLYANCFAISGSKFQ
jgi:hypothetical protein